MIFEMRSYYNDSMSLLEIQKRKKLGSLQKQNEPINEKINHTKNISFDRGDSLLSI